MVHALERARKHLRPRGALLLIQPHHHKRAEIAIVSSSNRRRAATLVNKEFQPRIDSANAAIETAIDRRWFVLGGRSDHLYRIRLENPNQVRRFFHLGSSPPRFPAGGRKRFDELWRRRGAGAQIEVTEHLTIIALRPYGV